MLATKRAPLLSLVVASLFLIIKDEITSVRLEKMLPMKTLRLVGSYDTHRVRTASSLVEATSVANAEGANGLRPGAALRSALSGHRQPTCAKFGSWKREL